MARVFLGLGSNIDRENNIRSGLDALIQHFGELILSPVYETKAVGFNGDPFYNLVVCINCQQSVGELAQLLRQIEITHGRGLDVPKFSSRTLDIDILTYDELVGVFDRVALPRDEICKNAFVLKPFTDIAGDEIYPVTGERYQTLWENFHKQPGELQRIEFIWNGIEIGKGGIKGCDHRQPR